MSVKKTHELKKKKEEKNIGNFININTFSGSKKNKSKKRTISLIIVKLIILSFIFLGIYYTNSSFENNISLLAVSENDNGDPISGSIINLKLETKPGSGNVYVNLETIEEVDTQVSIINSQDIACNIFNLNCDSYDFYYTFTGSALVLKGPSASTAIGILVAKNLRKEKIDNSTIMTGALNSGGVIGNVGGVQKKIETAKDNGFKKVLIPSFSSYNQTKDYEIEIVKVIDLIDAYNQFGKDKYKLKQNFVSEKIYIKNMELLAKNLCSRTIEISNKINFKNIDINSSEKNIFLNAEKSYNSSMNAKATNNFYSQGSFCYNANVNYRILEVKSRNDSIQQLNSDINKLKIEITRKEYEVKDESYINNIKTNNDFYVYLLINDRLEEAKELINEAISNPTNNSEKVRNEREIIYSTAIERLNTVEMWEKLIIHSGSEIKFDNDSINIACERLNRNLNIKTQLLDSYSINFFEKDLEDINKFKSKDANKFLCIYKDLELNGRINTVLNSIGILENESQIYGAKMLNISYSRQTLNSENDFPLIPHIYYEFATNLYNENDIGSSMLYANYALSYTDINLYLDNKIDNKALTNTFIKKLFEDTYFLFGILFILAFLSF